MSASGTGEDRPTDGATLTGESFHLHPLSIPYRVVERGIGIVLVVLFAGGSTFGALAGAAGAVAAVGLAVVVGAGIVGYAVAYHRRFEYELTSDTFDIRSGVLARREREIPLRRVQNVDISQNVVHRALGIAEIRLETAGASGSEAHLKFVSKERADALQREISRLSRSGGDEPTAGAERFETVFEISDRELGLLALVSADLRFLTVLFVGASLFAPSAFSMFDSDLFLFGPETIVGALFGPLAAFGTVVFLALVFGLVNATVYYGFTLRRAPEELRYERGLLQKFSGTIPLSKVQSLTIRENVLARALGYASLDIETAGQSGGSDGTSSQSAIPLADRDRVFELADSIESVGDLSFERPPKRARQRYAARYAGVLVLLAATLYVAEWFVDETLYWFVPLAALALVPLAAHLKWKHRGYHVGDDHVVTRNGFWVRHLKVVPFHRVQTVFSSETVFQRRRHIGTVTIDTAGARSLTGNDARAVDVSSETTDRLRERVADELHEALRERRATGRYNRVESEAAGD